MGKGPVLWDIQGALDMDIYIIGLDSLEHGKKPKNILKQLCMVIE